MYKYLFRSLLLILCSMYPAVELLGQMVLLFLILWGTTLLFSTAAAPFYIPISYILLMPQNTMNRILLTPLESLGNWGSEKWSHLPWGHTGNKYVISDHCLSLPVAAPRGSKGAVQCLKAWTLSLARKEDLPVLVWVPVTQSTLYNPLDCSPPGSSVHGISRQEHWNG